jgi:hypothetical protein
MVTGSLNISVIACGAMGTAVSAAGSVNNNVGCAAAEPAAPMARAADTTSTPSTAAAR